MPKCDIETSEKLIHERRKDSYNEASKNILECMGLRKMFDSCNDGDATMDIKSHLKEITKETMDKVYEELLQKTI